MNLATKCEESEESREKRRIKSEKVGKSSEKWGGKVGWKNKLRRKSRRVKNVRDEA